jgi:predicted nucleic acid-binding protein
MKGPEAFFDTNVLLYLVSADQAKADRAEKLLTQPGIVSVQVLNEFAAVASRKLKKSWPEIRDFLGQIRALCPVEPITVQTHETGLAVAEKYGYGIHDSMIIAAALLAGCTTLFSEDMQHAHVIENTLSIVNPFL